MEEPPFFLPEGFRFECLECGECCRGWLVPVDLKTKEALRAVDWGSISPALSGRKLFTRVRKGSKLPWALSRLSDGSCVFLDGGECLVHRVLGYGAKDLTCRQFPAKFKGTPDGVYVGFSFACSSVRENSGKPVAEYEGEYRRLYGEMLERGGGSQSKVMFDRGTFLDWGAYRILERNVSSLLSDWGRPFSENLYACDRMFSALRGIASGKHALGESDVSEFLCGGNARFRAPVPSSSFFPQRQRVVLGFSVVNYAEKESLLGAVVNPAVYYFRFVSGSGVVKLQRLGEIRLEELRSVEFNPEDDRTRDMLTRYFTHFLFRKSLLAPPSVADNLKLLVIGYALIRFYALCFAQARCSQRAEYGDVLEAVGCVDRYFLLHATQSKTLLSDKRTEFLLRKFLDDPEFVPAMLCEKPFTPPA